MNAGGVDFRPFPAVLDCAKYNYHIEVGAGGIKTGIIIKNIETIVESHSFAKCYLVKPNIMGNLNVSPNISGDISFSRLNTYHHHLI